MSEDTVLKAVEKEIFKPEDDLLELAGSGDLFAFLVNTGDTLPPWWSKARDEALRRLSKQEDHLAGTVSTLRDMLTAIPFKVLPRDNSIKSHRKQADFFQMSLNTLTISRSDFTTAGWSVGFGNFLEDFYTQDNGSVFAIDGEQDDQATRAILGRLDTTNVVGPLKPGTMATRLIHLDSSKCDRLMNRDWPLQYQDITGKLITFHSSRVIVMSDRGSPSAQMAGVGFCAVSRAYNTAQRLMDIGHYYQQKLGSRPPRGLIWVSGASPREVKTVQEVLELSSQAMDNTGLTRFAKLPIVGARQGSEFNLIDLASLPDGFDELTSTQLGMSTLALAFGVDVRTLSFAIGVAGQTKADAEIQHLKQRGKGPATVLNTITQQIETKFLPPHLMLVFDRQDDAQDQLRANIRKTRSERRDKDLNLGVTDIRLEREQMLEDGEISKEQFQQLELRDGRLQDGLDVLSLFNASDTVMAELLNIGIQNPLIMEENNPEEVLRAVNERIILVDNAILRANNSKQKLMAQQAKAALKKLKELYTQDLEPEDIDDEVKAQAQAPRYRLQKGNPDNICSMCHWALGTYCTLYRFSFDVGYICDSFIPDFEAQAILQEAKEIEDSLKKKPLTQFQELT